MHNALSLLAPALVIAGVWRIGRMDVRGVWPLWAAQALWTGYYLAHGAFFMAAQGVLLAGATWSVVRLWIGAGGVK